MVGIKYLKYFPECVFRLPTGLTIYRSQFVSPDGSREVAGGPHQVFTQIEKQGVISHISVGTYFVQLTPVRMGYQVNPDVHLLSGTQERFGDIDTLDSTQSIESHNARRALKKSYILRMVDSI